MGGELHAELSFLDQKDVRSQSLLECSFALRLSALLALTVGTPSATQSGDLFSIRSLDA